MERFISNDERSENGVSSGMQDKGREPAKRSGETTFWLVLGILALVLGYRLYADTFASREAAYRMQCTNTLKCLGLALQNYADANEGRLPAPFTVDAEGRPLHSWRVALLPYLEQCALLAEIRLNEPWNSEWNSQFHDRMPAIYACPKASAKRSETTYSVVVGDETAFPGGGKERKWEEIADGTWNTIAVVERKTPICWMDPTQEITFETLLDEMGSEHLGGSSAAMLDASVRFISTEIKPEILKGMATANGGEKY